MEVLGVSAIQRLIVPRVLASMLVALLLNGLVSVIGVLGGYFFNVVLQGGTPGRVPGELLRPGATARPVGQRAEGGHLRLHRRRRRRLPGAEPQGRPEGRRRRGEPVRGDHLPAAVRGELHADRGVPADRPAEGELRPMSTIGTAARKLASRPGAILDQLGTQMSFYVRALAWMPHTSAATCARRHAAARRGQLRQRRARGHRRHGRRDGRPDPVHRHRGRPAGLRGAEPARHRRAHRLRSPRTSTPARSRRWSPGSRCPRRSAPGFTAQLGAMRISEEIDALEVMAVPSLPFLVTTRIIAGFIAVIPLYIIGLLTSYLASGTIVVRSSRTVDRHLRPLLQPVPTARGRLLLVPQGADLRGDRSSWCTATSATTAGGGPAGVGVAVGRAVRTDHRHGGDRELLHRLRDLGHDHDGEDRGMTKTLRRLLTACCSSWWSSRWSRCRSPCTTRRSPRSSWSSWTPTRSATSCRCSSDVKVRGADRRRGARHRADRRRRRAAAGAAAGPGEPVARQRVGAVPAEDAVRRALRRAGDPRRGQRRAPDRRRR